MAKEGQSSQNFVLTDTQTLLIAHNSYFSPLKNCSQTVFNKHVCNNHKKVVKSSQKFMQTPYYPLSSPQPHDLKPHPFAWGLDLHFWTHRFIFVAMVLVLTIVSPGYDNSLFKSITSIEFCSLNLPYFLPSGKTRVNFRSTNILGQINLFY